MRPMPQKICGGPYLNWKLRSLGGLWMPLSQFRDIFLYSTAYGYGGLKAKQVMIYNLWFPFTVRFTGIGFYIPEGGQKAGSHVRMAIYHNKAGTVLPGNVLYTSPSYDTSTVGYKTEDVSTGFQGGKIYWASFCSDTDNVEPCRVSYESLWGDLIGFNWMESWIEDPDQYGQFYGISGFAHDVTNYSDFPQNPFPSSGWDYRYTWTEPVGERDAFYGSFPTVVVRVI